MKSGILENQKFHSPLESMKILGSSFGRSGKAHRGGGKNLSFSLNLTTLIDAFCILVIFLLSNMSDQFFEVKMSKGVQLPMAKEGENILSLGVSIRLEPQGIFLEDQMVTDQDLFRNLLEMKKNKKEKNALVIQADQRTDFQRISLILRAGEQAGYEKYLFAVLPEKK